jgi:hypothetical protein
MADQINYGQTQWARTVATTMAKHIAGEENAAMRRFAMLALLESRGRISYDNSGMGFDWRVRYKNHEVEGNTGATQRNFQQTNLWKTAALDYRGYQVTDSITKDELLANRGEAALIKVFDGMGERLISSMRQGLGQQVYVDGNATGNETKWHGIESMMGGTQTISATTGLAQSANATDTNLYPSDTYAGLSTILGNYGGDQETSVIWPRGIADAEYDFWTPNCVSANSSHADFPSSTNTWVGQADEVLRFAIIHSQRNQDDNEGISQFTLTRTAYAAFANLIDSKEQININKGEGNGLVALGFRNVIVFDGVEVTWEVGVPSLDATPDVVHGYGWNPNNCELMAREDQLFKLEGPEYDIHTQRYNAVLGTLSNLKFRSPRNFCKIADYA